MNPQNKKQLIENFCLADDLKGYDPYDIWMTNLGIGVKQLFNKNKYLGLLPAATLTIWDNFLNNGFRFKYRKREYPAARALAAQSLLNVYEVTKDEKYVLGAKRHIDWLIANSSRNYSGLSWGLGFKWAVDDGLDYDENTPFSTHTPYGLEAIHKYIQLSGNKAYEKHIKSIYAFFEHDIQVMFEDGETMATSYGPSKDRLVTNAVSYTLFAYAIFLIYLPEEAIPIKEKIRKLYNFIVGKQLEDGSWQYEPDSDTSFIDCFHSCFVLKNIYKTNLILPLKGYEGIMKSGYGYVKANFYNPKHKLFKRFTLSNKPSIVKFDLYDNAEVLNMAILLNDKALCNELLSSIKTKFVKGEAVYSVIDLFYIKRNKNTLRWAVMPYLYALSVKMKEAVG
jgi:hypothetical protein